MAMLSYSRAIADNAARQPDRTAITCGNESVTCADGSGDGRVRCVPASYDTRVRTRRIGRCRDAPMEPARRSAAGWIEGAPLHEKHLRLRARVAKRKQGTRMTKVG